MSEYRILVTGNRHWTDRKAIGAALVGALIAAGRAETTVTRVVVVHGGAPGADTIAGQIARSWNLDEEIHLPDWTTHGRGAGPRRNAEMVDAGADVCLAFPICESPGTRGCIELARAAGIRVEIHEGVPA